MSQIDWSVLLRLSKILKGFEVNNNIDRNEFRDLLCEIDKEYCDLIDGLRDGFKLMMIGDRYSIFTRKLRMQLKAVFGDTIKILSYSWFNNYPNITSNLFDDAVLKIDVNVSAKLNLPICNRVAEVFKYILSRYTPDIIHIHYLSHHLFCELVGLKSSNFVPRSIITMWGSDMYRLPRGAIINKVLQTFWLDQADLVSVGNKYMRQDFIDVYGNSYNNKIRYAAFGLPTDIVYQDHYVTDSCVKEFAEKYSIPDDKIKIVISSSADPYEGHKYIVEELMSLPKDLRKKLFLLIPMTYGDLNYREKFEKILNDYEIDMDYIMFKEYMSDADIIALRKVADIVIFLPLTDAFSAFLQESLYLGNVVITGSWLPYGWIEENGIYAYKLKEKYKEGELSNLIENILSNLEKEKELSMRNKYKMVKMVSWQYNLKGWLKLYREALK